MPTTTTTTTNHHKQLINLFPLHPENNINKALIDEEDHNMAACIFSSCDDVDGAATTLTGILCSSGEQDHYMTTNNNPSPSSSVNYADEEVDLVRTAMRRNNKTERNDNDNDNDDDLKWVCYSEVVEENKKKIKIKKEVRVRGLSASSSSSSTSSYHHHYNHQHHHHHNHGNDDDHGRKLVLKLDYEKIMNSWVNKGPLYINNKDKNNKNPDIQTVPELQEDDFFLPSSTIGLTQCERENGGNEGSWTVPEMVGIENNDTDRGEDLMQTVGSNTMIHHREASVQRYKEKRRNRLFAKTIRYEVRKLNAEKRPRIKGRFVKRN